MKLALANWTGRILRFIVNRSSADSQVYLKAAGIDVDGLADPLPNPLPGDRP